MEIASTLLHSVMGKKYDFVVFGASGFTGQFVVEELARVLQSSSHRRNWAIAGRSEEKLRKVLIDAKKYTGLELENIPLIIADVSNPQSLLAMAKQTKVILNCVGPYRFFGEPVVKAAIDGGAHHLDISGEPYYLESMQLRYNQAAKDAGVYVIGACGWDSIPCEMGMQFARRQFDGTLNDMEMVVEVTGGPKGLKVHFGTFHSMIYGIAYRNQLKPIREQLFDKRLPRSSYKLKPRGVLFHHEGANGWCLPFMGADKPVVQRTQYYNHEVRGWKPVQFQAYIKFKSLFAAVGMMFWGIFFGITSSFACGRRLLEKHPKLFSLGLFSHEGPTRDEIEGVKFTTYLFGRGWSGMKNVKAEEEPAEPPTDKIAVKVIGPDPGYLATSTFLVACAMTLIEESAALPAGGGVMTPGSAFANTEKLIERLQTRGITFTTSNAA